MELKKHQEPLSAGKQIENLKALNLFIEDEAAAVKFLNMEHAAAPLAHSFCDTVRVNIYENLEIDFSKMRL